MLLSAAGFASQAQARVTDSLLPQIAFDFHTTVGAAALAVTVYAVTHGTVQFIAGPIGDRFGKFRTVAIASLVASILVAVCGTVSTLNELVLARLATGTAAGWVIPISMAYVADITPFEHRQPVLARYISGYILGQLFGQAAGGMLGDLIGWRNVLFVLAGMFAVSAGALVLELVLNPQTHGKGAAGGTANGFIADYKAILSNSFARIILLVAFFEGGLAWGAFTYIGADLHLRFGVSFTFVGITVAFFGVGGLMYAGLVKLFVYRLSQPALVVIGGLVLATAYTVLAFEPQWWFAPVAVTAIGLGFYMFHNTLQTNATQMVPHARGTAVAAFAAALYLGQTAGIAIGAFVIDYLGAWRLFLATAVMFPVLAVWCASKLKQHHQRQNALP
jgi:MFS transporter, YNFM family, putative membrane transport protein